MVKIKEETLIQTNEGRMHLQKWLEHVAKLTNSESTQSIEKSCELAQHYGEDTLLVDEQNCFIHGLQTAEVLAELRLDTASIIAAIIFPSVEKQKITLAQIEEQLGSDIAKLVLGVNKMDAIHVLRGHVEHHLYTDPTRIEKIRKMLLAMAEDVRVILIKLAEHLCRLRVCKTLDEKEKKQLAKQTQELYAPLANRLGVGQIKWEMEDLAFRYSHPDIYKKIACLLEERRREREDYLQLVIKELNHALAEDNVKSEVSGRIKHIYSIWRKMQKKHVEFSEIYDVRAVRILVSSIQDCYTALGTVHRLWRHIPKEFDDYIATPKANGYRSLHTAVIGPKGRALEVQIRTYQMHQESEFGVAAHWLYKEGNQKDKQIDNKLAWLSKLIDWQEEVVDTHELLAELHTSVVEDRIYILTPKGDIIDLPKGATPLDFAYQVHTMVGHRCRGGKVNGRIVPLTYKLNTGEQVEILTAPYPNPSRDWINPNLGYLKTSRARAKVQHWFKLQERDKNIAEGRTILERELNRLGVAHIDIEHVADKLNYHAANDVFAALATGDLRITHVINAGNLSLQEPTVEDKAFLIPKKPQFERDISKEITIKGVGNLLTQIARCCKPVPGDAVIGYITQGRGVSIHRQDCPNVLHVRKNRQERLIEVSWGQEEQSKRYPVDIVVRAYDRSGLLRDITSLISNEKLNVIALQTTVDKSTHLASTQFTIEVTNLSKLSRMLEKLSQLPNVVEARRLI